MCAGSEPPYAIEAAVPGGGNVAARAVQRHVEYCLTHGLAVGMDSSGVLRGALRSPG